MNILKEIGFIPNFLVEIPQFNYLRNNEREFTLDKLKSLKQFMESENFSLIESDTKDSNLVANLRHTDEYIIDFIHEKYGEIGLARFNSLCFAQTPEDFKYFYEMIKSDHAAQRLFKNVPRKKLEYDNQSLKASSDIDLFRHNKISSTISYRLYNPGRNDGFMVYGLGGPRILISLPFKGANRFGYDIYNNNIDVITALMQKGFLGTFLLLDRLNSMDREFYGFPEWLVWFSFISSHSDLILFIKEKGKDLSNAQKQEVRLTPDRVPKKVVEVDTLTWAKSHNLDPSLESIEELFAIPGKGAVSKDDFYNSERSFAEGYFKYYPRQNDPIDILMVIHDRSRIVELPLINLA